jgi:hypothetical protein
MGISIRSCIGWTPHVVHPTDHPAEQPTARRTQLLGQLATRLRIAGAFDRVLPAVQRHLILAELTSQRRDEAALWELKGMRKAIDPATPVVVLKGCAYMVAGDANATGRLFSDVDLMVRRHDLEAVESALISVGWKPSRVDAYDLAYYRNWMHEVPPMEHVRRHTVCDLHHAINPPISRYYIKPEKLFERLVEVLPGIFVLSPTDRVIHCALHLLQEGEPKKLLRDLFDLHLLLGQHCGSANGMEQLQHRAKELNVTRLVNVGIGASRALFAVSPHPSKVSSWLQACVVRAARDANGNGSFVGEMAGIAVLAHSHWMKMPMRLLLPHLARKTWLMWFPEKSDTADK